MTLRRLRGLSTHRDILLTLCLVVGIAWLRGRLLGYTEMWGDQALTLNAALEWVHGGALPLASMKSSFGVFNPPLIQYLYALPLALSPNLVGVVWWVALVNLAGVLALGWAAARVVGRRTAAWAMLLFAVNPWAVYYGRLIWMQSFVPGFAALTLAGGLLYFADRPRWRYALGTALALAATIQVHLTAVVLLPVVLLAALVYRRHVRWPHVLGAAAAFALTWLPFLWFEIRNDFVDWHALRAGLGLPAQVSPAAVLILLDLLHGRGSLATLALPGDQWAVFEGPLPMAGLVGVWFGAALLAAAVGALRAWRTPADGEPARRAEGRVDVILLLWTILPLLFYLRHNQYLQNYYLLYVLPAPLLLMARLAERVYGWLRARWPANTGWAAALAFAPLALIVLQQGRLDWMGQNRLASGEVGQQRVVDVQQAIVTGRALLAERPGCALVVMSNGAQYESSRFALLREFTRLSGEPARARFVSAADGRLLPAPCALYFETEAEPAARAWLAETARPLPGATVQTPGETWQFFDLPAAARAAAAQLPLGPPLATWDNGLALRQASLTGAPGPGNLLEVTLRWAVEQPVAARTIHFGVYLLDERPTLLAQADGPGVDSTEWRTGDLFETTFTLQLPPDLPPGTYDIATALYYYPEIERLPLAGGGADLLFLTQIAF